MFSHWDPSKECKCCEEPEEGTGREHRHWDVYYINKLGAARPQGQRRICTNDDPSGDEASFKLDNYFGLFGEEDNYVAFT